MGHGFSGLNRIPPSFRISGFDPVLPDLNHESKDPQQRFFLSSATLENINHNVCLYFSVQQYDSQKETEFRKLISDNLSGDWDISYSQNNVTITMKQNVMLYLRDQAVRQSEETIWNRVDEFGLTEPTIQRQGGFTGDRIIVELPGIENPDRIKNIIKTTS